MKIAYFLMGDYSKETGVVKKITSQINCWNKRGIKVKIFHLSTNGYSIFADMSIEHEISNCENILFHSGYIYECIQKYNPDLVYMRYALFNAGLCRMLKKQIVVAEINSDDVAEYKIQKNDSLKRKVKYYYNLFTRKLFLRLLTGAVFVSFELEQKMKLKISTIVIENGCGERCKLRNVVTKNIVPQLLFIGTPEQSWHGMDKLLKLAKRTKGKLEFHVIGIDYKSEYAELDNVKFYGWLNREKYQNIFDVCDVGVGALALHRKKMMESSSLKTREYLMNGLPIILGGEDTTLKKHNLQPQWVLNIGNYENNVKNTEAAILDFAKRMSGKRIVDTNLKYFDWEYLEDERLNYFKTLIEKKKSL
ncbi:MAG: hypothetical protein RR910_05355 [Acidaminococcaceae bacterium]